MGIAIAVVAGLPFLLLGIYAWGRAKYGEKWYLAFGDNSTWGPNDPLARELEEARFTSLHLNDSQKR